MHEYAGPVLYDHVHLKIEDFPVFIIGSRVGVKPYYEEQCSPKEDYDSLKRPPLTNEMLKADLDGVLGFLEMLGKTIYAALPHSTSFVHDLDHPGSRPLAVPVGLKRRLQSTT